MKILWVNKIPDIADFKRAVKEREHAQYHTAGISVLRTYHGGGEISNMTINNIRKDARQKEYRKKENVMTTPISSSGHQYQKIADSSAIKRHLKRGSISCN